MNWFQKSLGLDERITVIKDRFSKVFGDHLSSLTLYGSALGNNWHPDHSDLNLIAEFRGDETDILDWAAGLKKDFTKYSVSVHWFEEGGLARAADVFPIELLDLKLRRKVLIGSDPMDGVVIYRSDLRLACERFAREKILSLRTHYCANAGEEHAIRRVLLRSAPGWASVFQAVLYMNNMTIPEHAKERTEAIGEKLDIDTAPFEALFEWRKMPKSGDAVFLMQLYRSYLRAVKGFIDSIDRWEEHE